MNLKTLFILTLGLILTLVVPLVSIAKPAPERAPQEAALQERFQEKAGSPYDSSLDVGGNGLGVDAFVAKLDSNNDGDDEGSYILNLAGTAVASEEMMYWGEGTEIHRAFKDGTGDETLISNGIEQVRGIAIDPELGYIYFTGKETGNSLARIFRSDLDGGNLMILVSYGGLVNVPTGIDIDTTAGKVYWTDHGDNTIRSASITGGSSIIERDLGMSTNPNQLIVDTVNGIFIWSQEEQSNDDYGRIRMANIDGTGDISTLNSSGLDYPYGIELGSDGNLYFVDHEGLGPGAPANPGRVYNMNADGSGRTELINNLPYTYGIQPDIANNHIYYTNYLYGTISRSDLDGSNYMTILSDLPVISSIAPITFGPQQVAHNQAPTITLTEPDGTDDTADTSYTITWTDDDPDDDASISLYYDNDDTGEDGTLIVSGLSEDDVADSYVWDTSALPDGDYYVYAVIDDGTNPLVVDYSADVMTVNHIVPEINIKKDTIDIPSGGSYYFGSIGENTKTDIIFIIENTGTGDLILNNTPVITITGTDVSQFSVQVQPTTPVTSGSNTTFTIRFQPTSAGAKNAQIVMNNNDSDENPYSFNIQGEGVKMIYATKHAPGSIISYDINDTSFIHNLASGNPLGTARGITNDLYGNLLVSSGSTNEVLRYNANTGEFIDVFVSNGSGGLIGPAHMTYGPDRNLYVAGQGSGHIHKYDGEDGSPMGIFTSISIGSPIGLTFGDDNNLYVADFSLNSVLKFDGVTGEYIENFIAEGSGSINAATGIEFGTDGNLYVGSYYSSSIKKFDGVTGGYIDDFVTSRSGGLYKVQGFTFGDDGHLYVAGLENDRVLIYDGLSGDFIGNFPSAGRYFMTDVHFIKNWDMAAPDITVSPTSISVTLGTSESTTETLTISNEGNADLDWEINSNAMWLGTTPTTSTITSGGSQSVTVEIDATNLVAGTYTDTLTITSKDPDEPTIEVPVSLTVSSTFIAGDCNGDGNVDAGDISALVLKIFDGGFENPGCDSNGDGTCDAGDISCTILIIFEGPGACTAPPTE